MRDTKHMIDIFWQYNGDSLYLAAFAVSIGLLVYQNKKYLDKNKSNTGKKAVIALLLAVLLVFNEAAYQLAGKITDAVSYYRFFWMLPVTFCIAYQLTEALASRQKKKAAAAVIALALCLAVGGNFFITRMNMNRPKNIYGLAPDTLVIADAIMADWQATAADGTEERELPVAALDMYMEYQVRTYEPRICWGISRKAYLYQAQHGYDYKKYTRQQHIIAAVNEGLKKDSGALRRSLDKTGVDYLVIRTDFDMDSYLAAISVFPAAQSESYTIYKVDSE